jgi:hypothetical protein
MFVFGVHRKYLSSIEVPHFPHVRKKKNIVNAYYIIVQNKTIKKTLLEDEFYKPGNSY